MSADWHETTRNMGGVLAAFVRRKFPRDTIKRTAAALDCTLAAAANVTKGHASERMITRAFLAWPWELADATAEAFSGETRVERLQRIIEEEAREQEERAARRAHVRGLEERAAGLLAARRREVA